MTIGRTIIIGDVHGCSGELQTLIAQYADRGDRLFCTGDLVNRGPDPCGVLELVRTHNITSVLGNHEDALLKWRDGWRARIKDYENETIAKLTRTDWDQIAALPLYVDLSPDAVLVHAGVLPGRTVASTDRDILLRLRSFDAHGRVKYRSTAGTTPWANLYGRDDGPFVVFGHSARTKVRRFDNAICIDTGCVYGGFLSAYILEEDRVVQVRAEQCWYDPHTHQPLRSSHSA